MEGFKQFTETSWMFFLQLMHYMKSDEGGVESLRSLRDDIGEI